MSNCIKIRYGLGMVLAAGFALTAGSAAADVPDALADQEDIAEVSEALVSQPPPNLRIACTASGNTITGREWAYLLTDQFGNCYRERDGSRAGQPAPSTVAHCKSLGRQMGCPNVQDL